MKKRFWIIMLSVLCIVFLTGCKSNENVSASITPPVTPNDATSENASATAKVSEVQPTSTDKASAEAYNSSNNQSIPASTMTYQITKEVYTDKSAKINYPQITNLGDDKRMKTINELIQNDILESFYKGAEEGMTLDIDYTIKLEEANLLSIQYLGLKNLQGASYPNNVLYTTNININKGSKLKLADLVIINENLVVRFKKGNYIAWEGDATSEDGKALKAAVVESVNQIDPNDLSKYLNESDEISEKNSSGTFSYLTKDSIGISLQIPHTIGDHAEFEIKYKDITDNLKAGNGTVKEFAEL